MQFTYRLARDIADGFSRINTSGWITIVCRTYLDSFRNQFVIMMQNMGGNFHSLQSITKFSWNVEMKKDSIRNQFYSIGVNSVHKRPLKKLLRIGIGFRSYWMDSKLRSKDANSMEYCYGFQGIKRDHSGEQLIPLMACSSNEIASQPKY